MDRAAVERELADCAPFSDPDPALEQYPTPADLAAHIVHLADLHGDLGRSVVDLGAGTGVLALGAALKGARVVGVECDPDAIAVARENATRLGLPARLVPGWTLGDATRPPLCPPNPVTIVANPPFGAQTDSEGDRPFLRVASMLAAVSYTVHNAGSRGFVEAFARDNGGEVTHAVRADLDLDRQFPFHDEQRHTVETLVARIEWD